jgi:hypothetical protein
VNDGYFGGRSVFRWRVTICTPEGARVRVRTSIVDEDDATVRFRWVINKRAGCQRRRFTARTSKELFGWIETRLKAAWRDEVRYTKRVADRVGGPS